MEIIKKIIVASIVLGLAGCGDNDVAPYLDAESTSSCRDISYANGTHNLGMASDVFNANLRQISKEYTGGSDVQEFVREGILNSNGQYRAFLGRFVQHCKGNPDLGTNTAVVDVINQLYQETKTTLSMASCKSFNDGLFKNTEIIAEFEANSAKYNLRKIAKVLKDPRFGEDYFKSNVEKHCAVNPYTFLTAAYRNAANSAERVISSEIYAAEKVEEDKRMAEEQRRKQALHLENLDKYGKNLYASNAATCQNLATQYALSFNDDIDSEPFKQAVMATLGSIPHPKLAHQKEAYEKILKGDPDLLISSISSHCADHADIDTAVLNTRWVAESMSPAVYEIKNKYYHPAALEQAIACENQTATQPPCFDTADNYMSYYHVLAKVKQLNDEISTAELKLSRVPDASQILRESYAEPCKQKVIAEGYYNDEYDVQVKKRCPKEAINEYFKPVRQEIKSLQSELNVKQNELDELLELGALP